MQIRSGDGGVTAGTDGDGGGIRIDAGTRIGQVEAGIQGGKPNNVKPKVDKSSSMPPTASELLADLNNATTDLANAQRAMKDAGCKKNDTGENDFDVGAECAVYRKQVADAVDVVSGAEQQYTKQRASGYNYTALCIGHPAVHW